MPQNCKEIFAQALLQLCSEKPLKSITIQHLLETAQMSRQSFYNHFQDKQDLIAYIYTHKIICAFDMDDIPVQFDFRSSLIDALERMQTYRHFLKQALLLAGQNCLKEFIVSHCQAFDLAWHQKRYGEKPMPDALRFATIYHATASVSMTIGWILSDFPVSAAEIAGLITDLRGMGMEALFANGAVQGNPYAAGGQLEPNVKN